MGIPIPNNDMTNEELFETVGMLTSAIMLAQVIMKKRSAKAVSKK